ncbi:conserved Plasmodium protein, unknown function [Plasmodium sp. DRC-Itaito]|nr:conserved Plasmodium protein, unknown function [Plasmodium sp. DRC-Itaito]
MKRHISPCLQREIFLCNNQKNNKRCLVLSLNNKLQFVMKAYSIQNEEPSCDVENVKYLLNDQLCYVLYNINNYCSKYQWILILWVPEKNSILIDDLDENKEKKNNFIHILDKGIYKYNNATNKINKLLYYSFKQKLLDIIFNNYDIPLFEINNFVMLEKCIHDCNNKYYNYTNCCTLLNTEKTKPKNYSFDIYNQYNLQRYYLLNIQLRSINNIIILNDSSLCHDMKRLLEEANICLNLFYIDIHNYKIISTHLNIDNIEQVHSIIKENKIFYVIYKVLDTYTFFYICNEICTNTKEKFLYSFFKPYLVEYLKKIKNIPIFLSIELSKTKHLIRFINADLKKNKNKNNN